MSHNGPDLRGRLNFPELLCEEAFISGTWRPADSGERIVVRNPASGHIISSVPKMGRGETRFAIDAAARAFLSWRSMLAAERGRLLRKWRDEMIRHLDDLALIMTVEQGKPLAESKSEIEYAASYLGWFAEEATRNYGDVIPEFKIDTRVLVTREPIGVCAAITPWNFPSAMITRKAGPALAAGCPIIVKPASATPLSALALARLSQLAGIPEGVFSVITGSASEICQEITSNPLVRKLSFTGSTEVGKRLVADSATNLTKLSLELGGNAPFLVFDDADLEAAIEGAMASKFRNSGQTCVCTNRFLVHDTLHDEFVEKLSCAIDELVVGPGDDPAVTVGPLIDLQAAAKVIEHARDAVSQGATLVRGSLDSPPETNFMSPILLSNVPASARVTSEETFGPLAAVLRFKNEHEAITIANDTRFGLAAYLYTRDIGRILRVSGALEYGMVGVNEGIISSVVAPFGGVKESGYGREGSRYGMNEYTVMKYILLGGGSAESAAKIAFHEN